MSITRAVIRGAVHAGQRGAMAAELHRRADATRGGQAPIAGSG